MAIRCRQAETVSTDPAVVSRITRDTSAHGVAAAPSSDTNCPPGAGITAAGRHCHDQALRVLDGLDAAVRTTQANARGERGVLRVGFTMSAAWNVPPALIKRYGDAYPDAEIRLSEVLPRELNRRQRQSLSRALLRMRARSRSAAWASPASPDRERGGGRSVFLVLVVVTDDGIHAGRGDIDGGLDHGGRHADRGRGDRHRGTGHGDYRAAVQAEYREEDEEKGAGHEGRGQTGKRTCSTGGLAAHRLAAWRHVIAGAHGLSPADGERAVHQCVDKCRKAGAGKACGRLLKDEASTGLAAFVAHVARGDPGRVHKQKGLWIKIHSPCCSWGDIPVSNR